MLNRLYIVVGVLAILAIAAAFLVPRFVQWGDYRDRMEALASDLLDAPVVIVGDIEFSLLPQPQLSFTDLRVGDPEAPVATVAAVQAQFSLVEFLRDRYHITQLTLEQPEISARIGEDGRILAGYAAPASEAGPTISVASAQIVGGSATLSDDRSGARLEVSDIAGELRIEALSGPFSFSGTAIHEGTSYRGRISTSAVGERGEAQLSLLVAPRDESYVLVTEGQLTTGETPSFDGSLTYRSAPRMEAGESRDEDIGRGALVITGKVQANPARVLLSDYTIVPDENRPATRLTGAADVTLGIGQQFNAVISGGIVALPPRSGTADPGSMPYEIVRLLAELPAPLIPGLPGTVGIDIAEVSLRAASLRNVRVDATTDTTGWRVDMFSAQLPGGGTLAGDGRLTSVAGRPEFGGRVTVSAPRLDTLAGLWRPAGDSGVLFGVPGELSARVSLVGETLSLSGGTLLVGGAQHVFSTEIGYRGAERHLHLNATLGEMTPEQSAALMALLPDIAGNGQFGATFSRARFDVTASGAVVADLAGRDLTARGTWEGGVLTFDRLAGNLGGVSFDGALTAFGTISRPELSGQLGVAVADASAPGLQRLYELMGTPQALRDWLARSVPTDLEFNLDPPTGDGGQGVHVTGRMGTAEIKLDASFAAGLLRGFSGAISARLDVHAPDAAAFTAQLGLGDASLTPEDEPMRLVAVIDGNAVNSFAATVRIEGGRDSIGFSGNIVAGNLEAVSGNGAVQIALSDPTAISRSFGVGGVALPPLSGSAQLDFSAANAIRLDQISVSSGGERASGSLAYVREGGISSVTGRLKLGSIAPEALLAVATAPVAAEDRVGPWPRGRFEIGESQRQTSGRIQIDADRIGNGEAVLVAEPSFILAWDAAAIRLRDLKGRIGGGTIAAEIGVCCAGSLADKEFSGRVTLSDLNVADFMPAPVSAAISGNVTAAARFTGTGDTFAGAVAAMTGEGSFTLNQFSIAGLSPAAFDAVDSLEDVLDVEASEVADLVIGTLQSGDFSAADLHGSFTIAGGVLRSPNLAIEGGDARLFGGTTLRLTDLVLGGSFAMSPKSRAGPNGMLTEANTQIVANLSGTLDRPQSTFDVTGMVDTLMVNAYEIELARLERLREEEEARLAEAAEERRRIAEEEAAREAAEEEAAREAAEAEAAREAAEAEAARRAAEEEAALSAAEEASTQSQGIVLQPGFNLDFTPATPTNQF